VGADLDGGSYTIRLIWNGTDSYWYVRVLDNIGQTVLMADRRLIADWPLWKELTVRTPPGFLIARDTSGQGIAPSLTDLGSRVQLYYASAADLVTLGIS
jgi:hypothetical protein